MLYFLVALAATFIGTLCGAGGGIIIRPVLAVLGAGKTLASSTTVLTVFAMGITNLVLAIKKGEYINIRNISALSAGSIIGGFVGASLMPLVSERFIEIAYLFVVAIMLLAVMLREKLHIKPVNSFIAKLLLGLFSGILASFFGIGGGPILMTILLVFLKQEPKAAAIQSILITLLTATSSMIQYAISGVQDFSLAAYCVPAGVLGGILGRMLSGRIKQRTVKHLFFAVLLALILLQASTVIRNGIF